MLYEINKEIVFNTGHIPENEAKYLDSDECDLLVQEYMYGWRIWVDAEHDFETPEVCPNIIALLDIAKENECKWLVLDCDGEQYDLPTFEW